jgi:hypothetical protein
VTVKEDQNNNQNEQYKKIPAELLKTRRGLHASEALNEKEKNSQDIPPVAS